MVYGKNLLLLIYIYILINFILVGNQNDGNIYIKKYNLYILTKPDAIYLILNYNRQNTSLAEQTKSILNTKI